MAFKGPTEFADQKKQALGGGCMETDKLNPANKSRHLPKMLRLPPGQAMVEFVLVFPVFLLIVLGIFEFGWLFVNYTSVYAAAREGARYGAAVNNLCKTGIDAEAERAGFLTRNMTITTQYQIFDDNLKWISGACSDAKVGDRIVVTVETQYEPITGYIFSTIAPINLSSQASRTIVKEAYLRWTLRPPSTSQPSTSTPTSPSGATHTPSSATRTPTATLTPEPPPPGICNGTITWTSNNNTSMATFVNNSGQQYTLTKMEVTWKASPKLKEVIYVDGPPGSNSIEVPLLTSPATVLIDPPWVVGVGSSQFEFIFSSQNPNFTGVTLYMTDRDGNNCRVH